MATARGAVCCSDKQCGARLRREGPRVARCGEAGVCQQQCVVCGDGRPWSMLGRTGGQRNKRGFAPGNVVSRVSSHDQIPIPWGSIGSSRRGDLLRWVEWEWWWWWWLAAGGGDVAVEVAGVIEACSTESMLVLLLLLRRNCMHVRADCQRAVELTLQAWTESVPNPRGAWKVETGRRQTVCGLSQPMQLGTRWKLSLPA
jgi:hypothetical protein